MDFDASGNASAGTHNQLGFYLDFVSSVSSSGGNVNNYGWYSSLSGTGTNANNYGLWTSVSGGSANYALWAAAGDVVLDNDNQHLYIGESQTTDIYDDGADTVIDPHGDLLIGAAGEDSIKVGAIESTNANTSIFFDGTGWVFEINGTNILVRVN